MLPFTAIAQQEYTLFKHGSNVQTVAYSPVNPFLIASAGDNGEVIVSPNISWVSR